MPCLSLSLSEMRKLLIGIANQVGQFSVDCAWYYIFSFSLRVLLGRIDRTKWVKWKQISGSVIRYPKEFSY